MKSWIAMALALVAGGGIGAVVGFSMGRRARHKVLQEELKEIDETDWAKLSGQPGDQPR